MTNGPGASASACARFSRPTAKCFSSSTERRQTRWRSRNSAGRFTASFVTSIRTSKRTNAALRNFFPADRSSFRYRAQMGNSTWRRWKRRSCGSRGVHSPKPRVISITQATELGTVYQSMRSRIAEFARRHSLRFTWTARALPTPSRRLVARRKRSRGRRASMFFVLVGQKTEPPPASWSFFSTRSWRLNSTTARSRRDSSRRRCVFSRRPGQAC